ncbi:MAG: xanthine dehydrogenase family protein molybdopterin-binding subunit, partial [Natrinema limicola]
MSKKHSEADDIKVDVDSDTGYPDWTDEPYPVDWKQPDNNEKPPDDRKSISKAIDKMDDRKLVTGEGKFTADYRTQFQDLIEGKILRSEIANGRVTKLETSKAEEMDGVYAVITPDSDVVPDLKYTSTGQGFVEPSPWDMTVLNRRVRYVGDPIAAVAAKDRHIADRAVRAIEVEYEKYEPLTDFERAMDDDAPQLFEEKDVENPLPGHDYERNRHSGIEGELGDIEAGLDEADHTFQTSVKTQYQSHLVPEPHTTIAYVDEDQRFNCITSTQVTNHTRRQLARLYDVSVNDVRIHKPRLGSTFGSKQGMIIEPIAMALSLEAEQPVKLEMTREEEFWALRNRHPMRVDLEMGVSEDG